jgi:hypothetical protein
MKHLVKILMRQIAPAAAAVLLFSSCVSSGWQYYATKYDLRSAKISMRGHVNGSPARTSLEINCSPGRNGTIGLTYTVFGATGISGFDFNSFEGPYAPAFAWKLADIEVVKPSGTVKVKTAVAGSYTGTDDFSFTVNAMNAGASDVRRIAEMIFSGAASITVTIHDMKNQKAVICTLFPAAEAGPVIEKVLRGCCR